MPPAVAPGGSGGDGRGGGSGGGGARGGVVVILFFWVTIIFLLNTMLEMRSLGIGSVMPPSFLWIYDILKRLQHCPTMLWCSLHNIDCFS